MRTIFFRQKLTLMKGLQANFMNFTEDVLWVISSSDLYLKDVLEVRCVCLYLKDVEVRCVCLYLKDVLEVRQMGHSVPSARRNRL